MKSAKFKAADSSFFARVLTIRQFLTRRILAATALLLAVPAGLWGIPAEAEATATLTREEPAHALNVRVMTVVKAGEHQVRKTFTGLITARRTTDLAFERDGKIESITVDEGRQVLTGDPLAHLDAARLQISRREVAARREEAAAKLAELRAGPRKEDILAARAQVREGEKLLELLRLKNKRRIQLLDEGAISEEELDEASFGMDASEARLDVARHRLEELEAGTRPEILQAQEAVVVRLDSQIANLDLEIERSILRAPFDGTVVLRSADEGAVISAGQPFLRMIEDGELEARIGLPVKVAAGTETGSMQSIEVGGARLSAEVQAILPDLDPATRTRMLILKLKDVRGAGVFSGQTVRLELEESLQVEGFWIPTSSLVKGQRGLWSCYVVNSDANVERREVEILYSEAQRVLVRGTLQAGESLIAGGVERVVVGQHVRALED